MWKKWWIVVVVWILALGLTSCSKKKDNLAGKNIEYAQCDGTMGQFDVYVRISPNNSGFYEVMILPYQVKNPGDVARITLANQNSAYKDLITQVVLDSEHSIFAGYLTAADFSNYGFLAITSANPTDPRPFGDQTPERANYCALPFPGAGSFTQ